MLVPSFEVLSEELAGQTAPRPLVIPPVLEGASFDLNIPVPQQLTSTVAGVAQAIRQLFVVLNPPKTLSGSASGKRIRRFAVVGSADERALPPPCREPAPQASSAN